MSPGPNHGSGFFVEDIMDIFEFGDAKLRAQDIDPLYRAIVECGWSLTKRCQFTFAFVTFDHAGLAAKIVTGPSIDYWPRMMEAARGKIRGAPRRYFFTRLAEPTLAEIRDGYIGATNIMRSLKGTYADAVDEMKKWPYYGPTAYFKMADMAERVCGVPIDFSAVTPAQLASNAMVAKGVAKALTPTLNTPERLLAAMARYKWATLAPPHYDRPLNAQEFETILCYYSHDDGKNRHLPGMDIQNILAELKGWGKTAEELCSQL